MRVLAILLILVALTALGYLLVRYGDLLTTEPEPSPAQADEPTPPIDSEEPNTNGGDGPVATPNEGDPGEVDPLWRPDWRDPEIEDLPSVWRDPRDGAEYILIPGGVFTRGSNLAYNNGNERPEQVVFVSSFYIGKHAVTRAQFNRFIEAGGYTNEDRFYTHWTTDGWWMRGVNRWTRPDGWDGPPRRANASLPITGISWFEAHAFASWVGGRLPREVEWEKAARGTDGRIYPWGNEWDPAACNWRDVADDSTDLPRHEQRGEFDGFAGLAPVYAFAEHASPYGVVQMVGNTWEWCQDWLQHDFFVQRQAGPRKDRINPFLDIQDREQIEEMGLQRRVTKGGAFDRGASFARAAHRHGNLAFERDDALGMRVVLDVQYVRQLISELDVE